MIAQTTHSDQIASCNSCRRQLAFVLASLYFHFGVLNSLGGVGKPPAGKCKRESGGPEIFTPNSLDIQTARTHAQN